MYFVYMLASKRNGTLYIGVTSNLAQRVAQHKQATQAGFTKTYNVNRLVYFEQTDSIEAAIYREKQLKHWNRQWKIELIETDNPSWLDMANDL